jgi:hypothetical protein
MRWDGPDFSEGQRKQEDWDSSRLSRIRSETSSHAGPDKELSLFFAAKADQFDHLWRRTKLSIPPPETMPNPLAPLVCAALGTPEVSHRLE